MKTMQSKWIFSVLALVCTFAQAQNQQMLNDSLEYAKTLTPSSSGQIVNSSAVNSSAWSSTSVPTSTPTGMGQFSTPTTTSNYGSSNISGGLSTLGVQAQTDCSSYVNTGDAVADQRCAAINFMAAHCLTTTSGENKILGASGNSQSSLANCEGTYGSGQSQFDYGNTVTSDDDIFTAIKNAGTTAAAESQSCTEQTVTVTPAQYETTTCTKQTNVDNPSCNKTLDVSTMTVTQGSCTNGAAMNIYGCNGDCGNDTVNATWYCNSAAKSNIVSVADWAHGSACGNYGQTGTLDLSKTGWQLLSDPYYNCEGDLYSGLWMFTAYVNQACDSTDQTQCSVTFHLGPVNTYTATCSVGDFSTWVEDGTQVYACATATRAGTDDYGTPYYSYTRSGGTATITSISYRYSIVNVTQNFKHPAAMTVSGTPTWIDNCTAYE